jgi:hypothetical protein
MKIIISESQYNKIIHTQVDEDYPLTWNLEYFKSLRSFNKRKKYCDEQLIRISSGSSRIVYKIDDEKVLKLAYNKKGLGQNEIEIEYGRYYDIQDIVAKTFDYDDNNLWVEMELAKKMKKEDFKNIVGFSFEDYCNFIRYQYGRRNNYKHITEPLNSSEMWENEFINEIVSYMVNYDIPSGDLCRTSTYGLVKRNGDDKIVMIDYGLTEKVYSSYYQ